mmetsp:Transcript_66210/g.137969  ORF Transcript_66210/g.137969 Transcript_66210/m.137969 type:complete len:197 (+) Transcript_66210:275-865(+)
MNHECYVLMDAKSPLEVESRLLPEVLQCLLNHILFHRALGGVVVPKDMVLLDDLFYVRCDDAKMEKQVRDSSEAAANALKKKEAGGKVTLTFYEKGMWGDKVPWEEWVMHFVLRTEPSFGHREEMLRRKELETRVKELMWLVLKIVSVHREHLPKVKISDRTAICFPFEIKDPSRREGVLDLLGRAVSGPKVQVPL